MKQIIALASVFFSTVIFAIPPVILSKPSPAIALTYNDNTSNIITYTVTNNVPQTFPIAVSGISDGIQRITVPDDCGNTLPTGPSTCNIGINIRPSSAQAGSTVSQTLKIDYQGRAPLTSSISFFVETVAYVTPLNRDASNASQIQQYLLNQNGLLSFYENATQVEEHYGQMTFATVNGTQYAYILENGVIYCSINSNGTFNNCTLTTAPTHGINHPHGIAFATFNQQYAYLADPSSSSLFNVP